MRIPGWWTKLTASQLAELRQMCSDPSLTFKEIGGVYGKSSNDVGYYAKKSGLRLGSPRTSSLKKVGAPAVTLSAVDAALQVAAGRRAAIDKEIEELQQRRLALQIRFELDGVGLSVFGIVDEAPLTATVHQWLQFLNAEGPRKLREFVTANAKAVAK